MLTISRHQYAMDGVHGHLIIKNFALIHRKLINDENVLDIYLKLQIKSQSEELIFLFYLYLKLSPNVQWLKNQIDSVKLILKHGNLNHIRITTLIGYGIFWPD